MIELNAAGLPTLLWLLLVLLLLSSISVVILLLFSLVRPLIALLLTYYWLIKRMNILYSSTNNKRTTYEHSFVLCQVCARCRLRARCVSAWREGAHRAGVATSERQLELEVFNRTHKRWRFFHLKYTADFPSGRSASPSSTRATTSASTCSGDSSASTPTIDRCSICNPWPSRASASGAGLNCYRTSATS